MSWLELAEIYIDMGTNGERRGPLRGQRLVLAQRERSEGMKFAACPNCRVQYPLQRLGAHPEAGKTYTVLCSVCGKQFNVAFLKRWFMPLKTVTR